ncbi:MAG TPA: intein-containing DNA gyrase subunit A [Actinomycetes bacterium]|nr:intein-containing DNA gyrase subunit A [Actinomycetes bacterium]
MTDTTDVPPVGPHGRIEPVDLQVEMQRSYLDYAMSVIVQRALPDVRDGLKPVHRRVLYAMYDGGYRPDRGFSKCSRVVGDVMGQYHPHGDTAIYDTLVRLGQPWSLRYPLVHSQGNFGSPGDDRQAAMRYCVTGDTRVRSAGGETWRIGDVAPDAVPNSDTMLSDVKLLGRRGEPVSASMLFHSGEHPTLRMTTREGYTVTGTENHPVLCLVNATGVPMLLWKLLSEVQAGDRVVVHRGDPVADEMPDEMQEATALLLGAFVSEGWVSAGRAGFNNEDEDFFGQVVAAYDRVVGGSRYVYERLIGSGQRLIELDVQSMSHLNTSPLAVLAGSRSAEKSIPLLVWHSGTAFKRRFLQALFEGDGSTSALPRNTVQISYSTRSPRLAQDVQDMLLEFGIVSRQCRQATGEYKVYIGNRRDARLFANRVGFLGRKQLKLTRILASIPATSASLSSDQVPFVGDYLRSAGPAAGASRSWLKYHNIDRIERWEHDGELIWSHVQNDEARRVVEPLVDGRYYYAEVAEVRHAGVAPVWSFRVDTEDHAFITNGIVSHNTECRLAPLAMDMVRDIDRDTVDFSPNYDGRQQEPSVLPARFPNLLVNGSGGIAVGMATNIPPHNLREVASGVMWHLDHPDASHEDLLAALLERIKGPDFPTKGLIVGTNGIRDAYTTGRGSVTMRAVVEVEEDNRGRTVLVITELPYQVNPDALARKIAELADSGKVQGIADLRDDSSSRTGMRLVVVLKRDAVASVVRNNLYKHTQLQDTFGCNMLALVDGVPRTLALDAFIRHWTTHQIEVIVRRTRYLLAEAERRAHVLRGLLKALERIDEVIALIRASASAEAARDGLIELLEIDEIQAVEILNMQLRRLAALERQEIEDRYEQLMREIEEYTAILASEERQRQIVRDELAEIVEKYGDERRTQLVPYEGDMSAEDFIPEEDVVVTITRGGYAKRTRTDLYRAQRRGGKGVRGAQLRQDDLVEHFFVTTTHHWILFFTNKGRVYRAKAYQLPDAGRDARGQHVANLLAFQPDETIAQIIDLKDYEVAPFLVLATKRGLVKKTRLTEYDSNRTGGLIAINLREDEDGVGDELISARLVSADDDLLLVSRKAMSVRFTATDDSLRPMGRATSGVKGMTFKGDDELLVMEVARPGATVFTVTDAGFAKRSDLGEYRIQGRGGSGIQAMKFSEARGSLVGALVVDESDEVFTIKASGGVTRVSVGEVNPTGRVTMGVRFVSLGENDTVVAIARNAERAVVDEVDEVDETDLPAAPETGAADGSPAEEGSDE